MAKDYRRPIAWLGTLGSFGAGTVLFLACGGTVSNGAVGSTSEPVSVGAVSGPVTACASGNAHPNVCCESGPGQAAACIVYPDAPFTPCASGSTTYPDPRSCCPIDGSGGCAPPPPPPPNDAGAGSGGTCGYTCPVGWYSPPAQPGSGAPTGTGTGTGNGSGGSTGSGTGTGSGGSGGSSGGGCCQVDSSGAENCSGSSGTGPSCVCNCPACDPEGGACPPCACNCPPEPPPPPTCDACPPGWQTPDGEPLLCCETAPDGTINCFSQGVPPPPTPTPQPAGGTCFASGGAPGTADASTTTQCGCSESVNGTYYTVTCTDPGGTCTCSEGSSGPGGGTMGSPVNEPSTACNDMDALFSACGFPVGSSTGGGGGTGGSGGPSPGANGGG